jgi:hypothetical protein
MVRGVTQSRCEVIVVVRARSASAALVGITAAFRSDQRPKDSVLMLPWEAAHSKSLEWIDR